MLIDNFTLFYSAVLGACIGSFLNVCILRIPEKISIVFPPSSCPKCNYNLKWYDNIPILSFVMLKGKCRNCKTKISFQYPLVEIIASLFAILSVYYFSFSLKALAVFIFAAVLLVISFIDLKHKIIPDVISLPGIPFFLTLGYFVCKIPFLELILGIIIGGGSLYLIAFLYYLLTKKDGMGGGDIKLLAMIGAFLGYKGVFFTIFASSIIGTTIGIIYMLISKKDMKFAVPFGPFLSMGSVIYIFLGDIIISFYINNIIY